MHAELAALAGSLESLGERLTAIAETMSAQRDDLAGELYEVERMLQAAHRRLARAIGTT